MQHQLKNFFKDVYNFWLNHTTEKNHQIATMLRSTAIHIHINSYLCNLLKNISL